MQVDVRDWYVLRKHDDAGADSNMMMVKVCYVTDGMI